MKHKIIIVLLFLSLGLSQWALAQPQKGELNAEAKAKIEALKKAYITDNLALTEEQSVDFWPIYESFKMEERQLRKDFHAAKKKQKDMTDEEAEKFVDYMFELEKRKLNLKQKYYQKMKSIISSKQIIQLDRAEKKFRMEMMQRMKKHRSGKKGNCPE